MVEDHFAPGQDDGQIKEKAFAFMQNSILLIDNHQELQGIMLSILAKLAVIKYNDFGIECFDTLKDLMQSGESL